MDVYQVGHLKAGPVEFNVTATVEPGFNLQSLLGSIGRFAMDLSEGERILFNRALNKVAPRVEPEVISQEVQAR